MASQERAASVAGELVVFDPGDFDTYPSVCQNAVDVERRFGFTGGEVLLFDSQGNYLGQVVKSVQPLLEVEHG